MIELFAMSSAMKYFNNLDDAVGDHVFVPSLTCISPLRQILAFSLSNHPYALSFALMASLTGTISSVGRGPSLKSKVSLSNNPYTSLDIVVPRFSFVKEENLITWLSDFSSGTKSDRFI